ncbi:MAG: TetR/AcrR family transcriptional regulator [Salibacteraceae bacterium]
MSTVPPINDEKLLPWIQAGYAVFAQAGPDALKVESLAREVGKSKSSFYHHFADLEVFTEILLHYHLSRAAVIAQREAQAKQVIPDLLLVILDVKEDLLFSRQVRIHRNRNGYTEVLEKVNQLTGEAMIGIWAQALGLDHNTQLAGMVLRLSLENFYLQITEATLNYDWLVAYIENLQTIVKSFQQDGVRLDLTGNHQSQ